MPLQPVVLSGGSGTRLWPLSREAYPKQFLALTGEYSLLQQTLRRLQGLEAEYPREGISSLAPIVVCNETHRFLVAEQLRLIGCTSAAILLEPVGRNTAPALTLAALAATAQGGEDPVLLVMPADHLIGQEQEFRRLVAMGHRLAQGGAVVTFGIVPTKSETGYGYLRKGAAAPNEGEARLLEAFVEKPDAATAERYCESGAYLWNSGIFVLRASLWLRLLQRLRPDIATACQRAFAAGRGDGDFYRLAADLFASCPEDSIDYAVMEPLAGGAGPASEDVPVLVLPMAADWSDVGAWSALWEARAQDGLGNVVDGDTFIHDAHNNLLLAQHRLVAALGVDDLVVVETSDAVLVTTKDRAQEVKRVTDYLARAERRELRQHRRMHRPWGTFECIDAGGRYQVKRLTVKPGETLSLQMHHHRAEHWVVVSGTARVTCEDRVFLLTENQSTYIPVGARHRLENPGQIPLEIIEVQSGSYLGEDDILRFEDRYQRPPKD